MFHGVIIIEINKKEPVIRAKIPENKLNNLFFFTPI
jgi:hypothetical protein